MEKEPSGRLAAKFYYDTLGEQLIIGDDALSQHIESGGHPADVKSLIDLLSGEEELQNKNKWQATEFRWDKSNYISYGNWLLSLMKPVSSKKRRPLNEAVLMRARYMNIGPSLHAIHAEFGNTRNFYEAADIAETHRLGAFADWTEDMYISYLQSVGEQLGRKPTFQDLGDLARVSTANPSPGFIAKKFNGQRHVGIGRAIERAGWPNIYTWSKGDYVNWGVNFMRANNGLEPRASSLNFLSQRDAGPSARAVMNNFTSLINYKDEVMYAYESDITNRRCQRASILSEMDEILQKKMLPEKVIVGSKSLNDILRRYSQYKLATKVGLTLDEAVEASLMTGEEFLNRMVFVEGDELLLRNYAQTLNVETFIWPDDAALNRLSLSYWKMRPSKRKTMAPRKHGKITELNDYPSLEAVRKKKVPATLSLKNELQLAAQRGELPSRLLKGVGNGEQILKRFMRYKIISSLLPKTPVDLRVNLALPARTSEEIVRLVRKENPAIDKKEIAQKVDDYMILLQESS